MEEFTSLAIMESANEYGLSNFGFYYENPKRRAELNCYSLCWWVYGRKGVVYLPGLPQYLALLQALTSSNWQRELRTMLALDTLYEIREPLNTRELVMINRLERHFGGSMPDGKEIYNFFRSEREVQKKMGVDVVEKRPSLRRCYELAHLLRGRRDGSISEFKEEADLSDGKRVLPRSKVGSKVQQLKETGHPAAFVVPQFSLLGTRSSTLPNDWSHAVPELALLLGQFLPGTRSL
jgi:hypothetical protein